jgi:hypothetical protein
MADPSDISTDTTKACGLATTSSIYGRTADVPQPPPPPPTKQQALKQAWPKHHLCISCRARSLDPTQCPFYKLCPRCGNRGEDNHSSNCELKGPETRETPFGAFRIHPPEEGKLPWWVQLYRHNAEGGARRWSSMACRRSRWRSMAGRR